MEREKTSIYMAKLHEVIINPDSGVRPIWSQARTEFVSFVERTWRELMTCKTKENKARPSIALFYRMDIGLQIGLFRKEPPTYFVNEVEQFLNTSVWLIMFHWMPGMALNGK